MFKKIIIALLCLFNLSCGTDVVNQRKIKDTNKKLEDVVPSKALNIVKDFLFNCSLSSYANNCNKNIRNLKLFEFTNSTIESDEFIVGVCYVYGSSFNNPYGERKIVIKNVYAEDSYRFRALIWHELGHCIADMDHISGTSHIMNPFMLQEDVYMFNWIYFKEFFFETYAENASLSITDQNYRCDLHD